MSGKYTFTQAAALIEKASSTALPAIRDNVRRYFVDRPDELADLVAKTRRRVTEALAGNLKMEMEEAPSLLGVDEVAFASDAERGRDFWTDAAVNLRAGVLARPLPP